MAVPRPKRRAPLLVSAALILLSLTTAALVLPRVQPSARASNPDARASNDAAHTSNNSAFASNGYARARSSNLVFSATLGGYPDSLAQLGGNSKITPSAAPTETNI